MSYVADAPIDAPDYRANSRFVGSWYWYDWANSAFVTTVGTVLYGPYITSIAKAAACPGQDTDLDCATNLHVLGIPIAPGSLAPYTTTFATILSAIVLIFRPSSWARAHGWARPAPPASSSSPAPAGSSAPSS